MLHRSSFYFWQVLCSALFVGLCYTSNQSVFAQTSVWHRINPQPAHCIAINPLSQGRIIYTTWAANGQVWRSDDYGANWQYYETPGLSTGDIHQILCLESDTSIVFAMGEDLVIRSTDGGMHWKACTPPGAEDGETMVYHAPSNTLYYGKNYAGALWKSTDRGVTWVKQNSQNSDIGLCTVAVSPDNPKVLLVGSGLGAISRSTDEGYSWTEVVPQNGANSEVPKLLYCDHAPQLAVATFWYATNRDLMTTSDGGLHWSQITNGNFEGRAWALEIDQRANQLFQNAPKHYWIGMLKGDKDPLRPTNMIAETTNGGATWEYEGLPRVTQVWSMKFDTTSGYVYAATDDGIYAKQTALGVPTLTKSASSIALSQNPMSIQTVISWPSSFRASELKVIDVLGRICFASSVKGQSSSILQRVNLPSGSYMIQVQDESGRTLTEKLLIQ